MNYTKKDFIEITSDIVDTVLANDKLCKDDKLFYNVLSVLKKAAESDEPESDEPESDEPESDDESPTSDAEPHAAAPRGRYDKNWLTPERLEALKQIAPIWLENAKRVKHLRANAKVNPILYSEGHRYAASSGVGENFIGALNDFKNSKEYNSMSESKKMRALNDFKKKFNEKNPAHHSDFYEASKQAHKQGQKGHEAHRAEKQAQLAHIIAGAPSGADTTFSREEAAQMAGGMDTEEGTSAGSSIDPAAIFARQNPKFIEAERKKQEAINEVKPKKSWWEDDTDDIDSDEELANPEIKLNKPKELQDPKNAKLINDFVSNHLPIVHRTAKGMLDSLGIPEHEVSSQDLAQEAGIHGLMQAVNDYDPNVSSFATHASNKIRGAAHEHLKNRDSAVGAELRRKAKEYAQAAPKVESTPPVAPPASHPNLTPPAAPTPKPAVDKDAVKSIIIRRATKDGALDRIQHIDAAKLAQGHKKPEGTE